MSGESELRLWEGSEIKEREPIARDKGDNWTEIISAVSGVPSVNLQGPELRKICSSTAGFRDQFYGLKEYVFENIFARGIGPLLLR